jgi:hypothetical protein
MDHSTLMVVTGITALSERAHSEREADVDLCRVQGE